MTLENIELATENKKKIKIISAKKDIPMKQLIVTEARSILDNNEIVPCVSREEDRSCLIIDIPKTFKDEIKNFCELHDVRIRDFWVECVNRINQGENND